MVRRLIIVYGEVILEKPEGSRRVLGATSGPHLPHRAHAAKARGGENPNFGEGVPPLTVASPFLGRELAAPPLV